MVRRKRQRRRPPRSSQGLCRWSLEGGRATVGVLAVRCLVRSHACSLPPWPQPALCGTAAIPSRRLGPWGSCRDARPRLPAPRPGVSAVTAVSAAVCASVSTRKTTRVVGAAAVNPSRKPYRICSFSSS